METIFELDGSGIKKLKKERFHYLFTKDSNYRARKQHKYWYEYYLTSSKKGKGIYYIKI